MGLLDGKVALVTGAGRGQGRSHARRLAQEGAEIIAMDICEDIDNIQYSMASSDDLAETVKQVEALDRRIIATHTDVRDDQAVKAAVDAGVAELGRLDIVVSNAGAAAFASSTEMSTDLWRTLVDVNLSGHWFVCAATIPHLIEGGRGGAIVLTSSSGAHVGLANLSGYSAAKAGVVGLMQSLAVELGPHMIRVNTIHPTSVNTAMVHNTSTYELFLPGTGLSELPQSTPEGVSEAFKGLNAMPIPWVEPEDITNAVVYLTSDMGRYVSGTQLRVDAGSAAR